MAEHIDIIEFIVFSLLFIILVTALGVSITIVSKEEEKRIKNDRKTIQG